MSQTLLFVSTSVQHESSVSRKLAVELIHHLRETGRVSQVVERDLSRNDIDLLTQEHIAAFYTPPAQRSAVPSSWLCCSSQISWFLNLNTRRR